MCTGGGSWKWQWDFNGSMQKLNSKKIYTRGSEWLNLVEIIDTITTNKSQSIMKKKNQIKPFKII